MVDLSTSPLLPVFVVTCLLASALVVLTLFGSHKYRNSRVYRSRIHSLLIPGNIGYAVHAVAIQYALTHQTAKGAPLHANSTILLIYFIADVGLSVFFSSVLVRCGRMIAIMILNRSKSNMDTPSRIRILKRVASWTYALWTFVLISSINVGLDATAFVEDPEFHKADVVIYSVRYALIVIVLCLFCLRLARLDDVFRQTWELGLLSLVGVTVVVAEIFQFVQHLMLLSSLCHLAGTTLTFGASALLPMLFARLDSSLHASSALKMADSQSGIDGMKEGLVARMDTPLDDLIQYKDERSSYFERFLAREFSVENLRFMQDCLVLLDMGKTGAPVEKRRAFLNDMVTKYFDEDSVFELNVPGDVRSHVISVTANIRAGSRSETPLDARLPVYGENTLAARMIRLAMADTVASVLAVVIKHVYMTLRVDSYPRFLGSKEAEVLRSLPDPEHVEVDIISS